MVHVREAFRIAGNLCSDNGSHETLEVELADGLSGVSIDVAHFSGRVVIVVDGLPDDSEPPCAKGPFAVCKANDASHPSYCDGCHQAELLAVEKWRALTGKAGA